jgi:DNA-binding NtrC family response regulator
MPAVQLDEGARALLQSHYWRGNVRQLKNVAEQVSALEKSRVITADVLRQYLSPVASSAPTMTTSGMGGEDFANERELLYKILFDMRSDINDVKRMLAELMHGSAHHTPAPQSEVIGLLPSSTVVTPAGEYAESEIVEEVPHRELTKADMQREQIVRALRNNNGRRRDAARELFMSERTLYRRIKELGIGEEDF